MNSRRTPRLSFLLVPTDIFVGAEQELRKDLEQLREAAVSHMGNLKIGPKGKGEIRNLGTIHFLRWWQLRLKYDLFSARTLGKMFTQFDFHIFLVGLKQPTSY